MWIVLGENLQEENHQVVHLVANTYVLVLWCYQRVQIHFPNRVSALNKVNGRSRVSPNTGIFERPILIQHSHSRLFLVILLF